MYLESIKLRNFRNFKDAEIEASSGINIIYGQNGSGKTSLLESAYYLSLARSFRTNRALYIVNEDAKSFTLFSKVIDDNGHGHKLGIERDAQGTINIRYDGNNLSRISELAQNLCVQFIAPENLSLLDDGPGERRAFLDWGGFYHFPNFCSCFNEFKAILKQRNALLTQKADSFYLDFWDRQFIEINEKLNAFRNEYITLFNKEVAPIIERFLPNYKISIELAPGFRVGDLASQLKDALAREYVLGYTVYGAHKADLKFKANGRLASEVLSRGQSKLLVIALKIAQGMIFSRCCNKSCVFLIDDITSELDPEKVKLLFSFIESLADKHQFFISCLDEKLFNDFGTHHNSYKIIDNEILGIKEK